MTEFVYNNTKNANTDHTLFKFYCSYHLKVSFLEDIDYRLRSRSVNELVKELKELIEVCYQNLLYA